MSAHPLKFHPSFKFSVLWFAFILALSSSFYAHGQTSVFVIPTQPWTDTGLSVTAGEKMVITATGEMDYYTYGCPSGQNCTVGPDGNDPGVPCTGYPVVAPSLPCNSLIGMIGSNGIPFAVGASFSTSSLTNSGELYLGVNDSYFPDNTLGWTASITLQESVTARIYFNGNDITNSTQSVYSGQEIDLHAALSGNSITSVESKSWTVPGDTVGGFMASQQTGVMVPTTLNNIDVRFYWIDAGPQRIVQFNYQLSNGTQGNAKTTFTVIGPTQTSVDISTGKILVFKDAEGLELGFGDYLDRSKVGIAFAASAALPSADNGTFLWVQIIKTDKDFLLYPHLFQACTSTPGLDTGFPYLTLGSSNMANDSPYLLLPIDARIVAREFSARMYLMWDPDLPSGCTPPLAPSGATNCSSIPVPIGYADWGFRAEAWNDRLTHQTTKYGWTPYGLLEPSTPFFVASQDFPEWTSYQSADGPISCVTY